MNTSDPSREPSHAHNARTEKEPLAHTPGPWRELTTRRSPPKAPDVVQVSAEQPHGAVALIFGKSTQQRQATARLIAAAPDLLEALGDLIAISNVMAPGSYGDAVLRAAVDAYAKAVGAPEPASTGHEPGRTTAPEAK